MANFLLEIGTEEIPARMLSAAEEELTSRVRDLLLREHLGETVEFQSFSSPRRIAVLVQGLREAQPDVEEQVLGPSLKVAHKDGQPTPAAHAFAKKWSLEVSALRTVATPKGDYLSAKVLKKGRGASALLMESLPKEIASIYWPKSMYWRGRSTERFVRPVRWMVALLDRQVIPLEFAGITAANKSRGHRILSQGEVTFDAAHEYAAKLEAACVVPQAAGREQRIRKALDAATRTVAGARWREDKELLATVVNLTEFPSVILGSFEPEYLSLPEEVLVTVMRDHQKYFAVEDASGKLAPHFLAVLNTAGDPDGLIRHGNERVLRARFNDARFFWHTDQKTTLRDRVEMLKSVTFQKDLGSYYEKALRTQHLASLIGESVRNAGIALRPGIVHKAALLAKTDLTTELVKEFTELQGIIGGLYAKAQAAAMQMDPAVGDAIYDHYRPVSMEDAVPRTMESAVLAIADKADSIAGMFALGMQPTGSKDPFALRRAGNGIVRILAEHNLPLRLSQIMGDALLQYQGSAAEKNFTAATSFGADVAAFFRERVEFYLRDVKGYAYDVVNAVLASGADNVPDALLRAEVVAKVRASEAFAAISIAFKRSKNILTQAAEKGFPVPDSLDGLTISDEGDVQLHSAMVSALGPFQEYANQAKYEDALNEMAKLRDAIDYFFDRVMVMVEDEKTRSLRLALLSTLSRQFSRIADFSEIVTERKGA